MLHLYPDSGYTVVEMLGGLVVTCPDHGPFSVSVCNFKHFRGCPMCRGCHPRAYPIGSTRRPTSHVVTVGGYSVGYADKRMASLVGAYAPHIPDDLVRPFMRLCHGVTIPQAFSGSVGDSYVAVAAHGVIGPSKIPPEGTSLAFSRHLDALVFTYVFGRLGVDSAARIIASGLPPANPVRLKALRPDKISHLLRRLPTEVAAVFERLAINHIYDEIYTGRIVALKCVADGFYSVVHPVKPSERHDHMVGVFKTEKDASIVAHVLNKLDPHGVIGPDEIGTAKTILTHAGIGYTWQ